MAATAGQIETVKPTNPEPNRVERREVVTPPAKVIQVEKVSTSHQHREAVANALREGKKAATRQDYPAAPTQSSPTNQSTR